MAAQRKRFRIEQTACAEAPSNDVARASDLAPSQHEIVRELAALRELIERRLAAEPALVDADAALTDTVRLKRELRLIYDAIARTKREIAAMHVGAGGGTDLSRVTHELGAVVGGTEVATQRILEAAEDIDQTANALLGSLKGEHAQGLTQDIQDRVIQIFEACNFQDLTGQRITKVMATLKFIEAHVVRMMDIWGGVDAFKEFTPVAMAERPAAGKLTNGPRLDGDSGHVSQNEIDAIFATAGLVRS
jgi:chemotaxis protein CheZ